MEWTWQNVGKEEARKGRGQPDVYFLEALLSIEYNVDNAVNSIGFYRVRNAHQPRDHCESRDRERAWRTGSRKKGRGGEIVTFWRLRERVQWAESVNPAGSCTVRASSEETNGAPMAIFI